MNNGFLSQEEIDSLLGGGKSVETSVDLEVLSDLEKDLLGEVGNISMGTAATALSTIIGHKVNITTPTISITTLDELKKSFETPNVILDVQFTSGITGGNILIMKIMDAAVIANLMMGGDGKIENKNILSEIELSAVQEAMNQMIGSAATSMATMFKREVNISPPISSIIEEHTSPVAQDIQEDEQVIAISFKMAIGSLIDSNILQVLPVNTGMKIVSIMMGEDDEDTNSKINNLSEKNTYNEVKKQPFYEEPVYMENQVMNNNQNNTMNYSMNHLGTQQEQVPVKQAAFKQLSEAAISAMPKNIDLILDVPLEVSVELGRTKKNIRDILALSAGSLIELNKLAEEPVDIYINGKKIAYGEVVVIDENFGVKITSIVSGEERIRTLSK